MDHGCEQQAYVTMLSDFQRVVKAFKYNIINVTGSLNNQIFKVTTLFKDLQQSHPAFISEILLSSVCLWHCLHLQSCWSWCTHIFLLLELWSTLEQAGTWIGCVLLLALQWKKKKNLSNEWITNKVKPVLNRPNIKQTSSEHQG